MSAAGDKETVAVDFPENLRHQPTLTQPFAATGGELWMARMVRPRPRFKLA